MRSMCKYELAAAAGVSPSTFRRWLASDREALRSLGVRDRSKILPPAAVKYLCEKYDVEVD